MGDYSVSYFNMGDYSAFLYSYYLDLLLSCFCAVLFVILLSLDARNAFKRKAYWFPGQALVLSAPIIQLLSFIDNSKLRTHSGSLRLKSYLLEDQLVSSSRRVMICVLLGYLLPGMASSSVTTLGSNFGALVLTIIIHMASELYFTYTIPISAPTSSFQYFVNEGSSPFPSPYRSPYPSPFPPPYRSPYPSPFPAPHRSPYPSPFPPPPPVQDFVNQGPSPSPSVVYESTYSWFWNVQYGLIWFELLWTILLTVLILFSFLFGCAVLAGKSIRNIISIKVPLALSSCCCNAGEGHPLQCHSIGDHVLKSWIVVRATQPDYIIARSVFSSFVGLVVTVCLVFLLVDWTRAPLPNAGVPELITLVIQFLFIITGWFIISIRWCFSVMYFPRGLRSLLHWEEFWTSNIVELKDDLNARRRERVFRDKRLPRRAVQENRIMGSFIAIQLFSFLLAVVIGLQKLMVLLSKACCSLSEIVFRMIRFVLFSNEKNALMSGSNSSPKDKNPFFKYEDALEIIRMPGETAHSLWIANESAFKKAEKHMKEGFKEGNDSSQLIKLKEHRTGYPHNYEASVSVAEEEFFPQIGKSSWKMKAVSLIRFMIFYYEDAVSTDIDDAIQAYCQAWPVLNIVDTSNPEANLVSEAADEEFDALEDIWKKHMKSSGNSKEQLSVLVQGKIKKGQLCQLCEEGDLKLLSDEEESKATKDRKYRDSFHHKKKWMKSAAAKTSVYKTRKALDLDKAHSMDKLKSLLANVIFACIDEEVDKAIIKSCNKWAQEGNEMDIYEVAFVAGIAEAVKGEILEVKVEEAVEEGSQIIEIQEC